MAPGVYFWSLGHSTEDSYEDRGRGIKDSLSNFVVMKLHQRDDFGLLSSEAESVKHIEPIYLERGFEYYYDVTPIGQRSSSSLKNLDKEERDCYLEEETHDGSIFKKYSKSKCLYECRVALVEQKCGCIPWDFMAKKEGFTKKECNIFGRSCFFFEMENVTTNENGQCPNCKESCDSTQYKNKLVKFATVHRYLENFVANKSFAAQEILNFGSTIDPYNNAFTIWQLDQQPSAYLLEDMIVVHLRFLSPDVNSVELTYSTWDKFANFGGNFGIFAEITGFSFLGLLHIIILSFKLVVMKAYSKYKQRRSIKNLPKVAPKA